MKTHTQETHDNNAQYLERMQKGLGHHSWWYTNRSSDDCLNVKMHCWVDTDKVLQTLTKKENEAIKVLSIDVDEWLDGEKWSLIEIERVYLHDAIAYSEKLQNKNGNSVHDIEYGGRSGGWLAVVFDLNVDGDYLEGYEHIAELYKDGAITKKEWSAMCKQADAALQYISDVHEYIEEAHKNLCTYLETPDTYTERLQEHIQECIQSEKYKIEASAQRLATLASN